MDKANVTQVQLAEATGLTQSAISNYLRSGRMPGSEELFSLAKFFKVSMEHLMGDDERRQERVLDRISGAVAGSPTRDPKEISDLLTAKLDDERRRTEVQERLIGLESRLSEIVSEVIQMRGILAGAGYDRNFILVGAAGSGKRASSDQKVADRVGKAMEAAAKRASGHKTAAK